MGEFPEVRALCQRVRRPTINLFLGLALIAPATVWVGASSRPPAAVDDPAATARRVTEVQAREAVTDALRQQYVDRERATRSARFAVRFRIPSLLAQDIYWAATRERIDPQMAFRLVDLESSFRSSAVSPVGAVGLTQVMPATARWLFPGTTSKDLLDSRFNLRVGFRYLRKLLDTYDDARLALLAYNRGPAVVDMLLEAGIDPENGYADFVLTGDRTRLLEHLEARRAAAAAGSEPAAPERRGS